MAEDFVSADPISNGHRITAAGLWRVTDPRLFIPEHGIHRLLVHNQVVWVVLVHGVNITGVCGLCQTPPKPVIGTEAVFVNAENGRQNGFLPLPARIH